MASHSALRQIAPFAAVAAASLALDAAPRVPWTAGAAGAAVFALAGAARRLQSAAERRSARRVADDRIMHGRAVPAWRQAELVSRRSRAARRRELERVLRAASADRMPSASPLNRIAVRRSEPLLRVLADRLRDGEPVTARGMLYVDELLRDPSSPLYGDHDELLPRAVARVIGALDE